MQAWTGVVVGDGIPVIVQEKRVIEGRGYPRYQAPESTKYLICMSMSPCHRAHDPEIRYSRLEYTV